MSARILLARADSWRAFAAEAAFWRDSAAMFAQAGRLGSADRAQRQARHYARLARLACGGAR